MASFIGYILQKYAFDHQNMGDHIRLHKKPASKLCSSFSVPVHFLSPRTAKNLKSREVKTVLTDVEVDGSRLIPFLEAKAPSSYPWSYDAHVYIRPADAGTYEFLILDTDGKYFEVMHSVNIEEFVKKHFDTGNNEI